jgi:hypothetical protein
MDTAAIRTAALKNAWNPYRNKIVGHIEKKVYYVEKPFHI